jgi:hypothetical protein
VVGAIELQAVGPADHEAHVAARLAAILEEPAEGHAVEPEAVDGQQRHVRPVGNAAVHALVLADLDEVDAGVAGEEPAVVLDVVGERRSEPSDGQDHEPHRCDTTAPMADDQQGPERHINIHFDPEHLAGKYANFANVSHSDYEFTITFARVDHEVEDDEIPGVVVSRINLSPKFMRELVEAMQDNYSKWSTREGIKNLPEFRDRPGESSG